MKPIFTIHAGEYLVASEIEKSLKNITIWLPSKDSGIDLLLTDQRNKKSVSIQVKFSKDFNVTQPTIRETGWWTLNKKKIQQSQAHFWIFILYNIENKSYDLVILTPKELLRIFSNLNRKDRVHCYITVTKQGKVFETRGLNKKDLQDIYSNRYKNPQRDLTKYLNNWSRISKRLK